MKVNRLFLFLTLISSWSGCVFAGEYENIVSDLKAEGLDPEKPVQLSSLEGLKVELGMSPTIRAALSSKPMDMLENGLEKIAVNGLKKNIFDRAVDLYKYFLSKNINAKKEKLDLLNDSLDEAERRRLESLISHSKREQLRLDEALKSFKYTPFVEGSDYKKIMTLKNNMDIKKDILVGESNFLKSIPGAYAGYLLNHVIMNPSENNDMEGDKIFNSTFHEQALAHEMGHAKHNAQSELLAGGAVGLYAGDKIFKHIQQRLVGGSPRSRLARAGLELAGTAVLVGGPILGSRLIGKHAETVAEISGLQHALPIYNASVDKKYDVAVKFVPEFRDTGSQEDKHGYLTKKEALYAAQRMYKPELHKPYETDNNPGQFLAEQGGV